jgi:hypothetical protein
MLRTILAVIVRLTAVLAIAVLLTAERGLSLLDPIFFIPFAAFSSVLVGPAAVRGHMAGRGIASAVAQACGAIAAILAVSIWLLKLTAPPGMSVAPSGSMVLDAAAIALSAAAASALVARRLLARFSAGTVVWAFRLAGIGALAVYRCSPQSWSNWMVEVILTRGLNAICFSLTVCFIILGALAARGLRLPHTGGWTSPRASGLP